jgi:hypothetical protein
MARREAREPGPLAASPGSFRIPTGELRGFAGVPGFKVVFDVPRPISKRAAVALRMHKVLRPGVRAKHHFRVTERTGQEIIHIRFPLGCGDGDWALRSLALPPFWRPSD